MVSDAGALTALSALSAYRSLVVGLTGGIASGKSSVSATFAELGAAIVDTDVIARELVVPGSAGLAAIVDAFGTQVLAVDGTLDRRRLRGRVFADSGARQQLEAILHPRIRSEARAQVARAQSPYVVLVVPLLIESSQYDWVDRIVVVDIPPAAQERLLMTRDSVDADLARTMIAAQAPRMTRLTRADDVIRNSGSLSDLKTQTITADRRFRMLSRTG